jgi:hypothetical protein
MGGAFARFRIRDWPGRWDALAFHGDGTVPHVHGLFGPLTAWE